MEITVEFVRDYLETLPCPICTKEITNEQINQLIDDVNKFTMSILKIKELDFKNEDVDEVWFTELEEFAIKEYKMQYYEDIDKYLLSL